jgi:hypothetical protein
MMDDLYSDMYRMYAVISNYPYFMGKFYYLLINKKYNDLKLLSEYIFEGLKTFVIFYSMYNVTTKPIYADDILQFFNEEKHKYEDIFGQIDPAHIYSSIEFIDSYDDNIRHTFNNFSELLTYVRYYEFYIGDLSYVDLDYLKVLFFPNYHDDGMGWDDIQLSNRSFSKFINVMCDKELGCESKIDIIFSQMVENSSIFKVIPNDWNNNELSRIKNIKEDNSALYEYMHKYNKSVNEILKNNIDMISSNYIVKLFHNYKNIIDRY